LNSNHNDFALSEVTKSGRTMLGLVARRAIGPDEVPVFVGAYAGYRRSADEIERKVQAYKERHLVDGPIAYTRATGYNLCIGEQGDELDPSDLDGLILPEFANYLALYANEPSPGQFPNAVLVANPETSHPELWLCAPVAVGEEVLTQYGDEYERDYATLVADP
jgi:hypothetical protein